MGHYNFLKIHQHGQQLERPLSLGLYKYTVGPRAIWNICHHSHQNIWLKDANVLLQTDRLKKMDRLKIVTGQWPYRQTR